MTTACLETAAQGHSRARTLLRLAPYYSKGRMLMLYKSQVLSYLEMFTPAIHHANEYSLSSIDGVQLAFLEELDVPQDVAFLEFNLAPLASRRDIAMLGMLHKIVLGIAPKSLAALFPADGAGRFPRCLRAQGCRHSRQLLDPIEGASHRLIERSAFGLVYAYNLLPETVVQSKTVSEFQSSLQRALAKLCKAGHRNWAKLFRVGIKTMSVQSFHSLFLAG